MVKIHQVLSDLGQIDVWTDRQTDRPMETDNPDWLQWITTKNAIKSIPTQTYIMPYTVSYIVRSISKWYVKQNTLNYLKMLE